MIEMLRILFETKSFRLATTIKLIALHNPSNKPFASGSLLCISIQGDSLSKI